MELFQKFCGVMILALLILTIEATEDKSAESKSKSEDTAQSTTGIPERDSSANAMPYVESSQFRSVFPKTESSPSSTNSRLTKTPTGKYIGMNGKNLPKSLKEEKANMKNAYSLLSRKKIYQSEEAAKPTVEKNSVPVPRPKIEDAVDVGVFKAQPIGFVPLPEEFPSAFVSLPSNEEYDRNSHFVHSILYGYSSGY
ncbi:hypothetical protein C0J52_19094 [Blattella germanica]|nr:hypothetical protein C0J52_19094 [Blattella germanica]